MTRPRLIRGLRIAWTVACAVLCLLLIGLWVRSNWCLEEYWINLPSNRGLGFLSGANCASIGVQRRDEPDSSVYNVGYANNSLAGNQTGSHIFRGFSVVRGYDASYVNIPYWFLVLFFAAAPWASGRFRLRTLLIATTIFAILLGLAAWAGS